jgi:hypothetical protein
MWFGLNQACRIDDAIAESPSGHLILKGWSKLNILLALVG